MGQGRRHPRLQHGKSDDPGREDSELCLFFFLPIGVTEDRNADPFCQIDYFVACWAIHRLNGICLPIHSTSTVADMASHLDNSRCQAIFACRGLVSTSVETAEKLSIPLGRIFMLPVADDSDRDNGQPLQRFTSLDQLIDEGAQLPDLEPLRWEAGQAKTQVAFLCPTSGTSGPQVGIPPIITPPELWGVVVSCAN